MSGMRIPFYQIDAFTSRPFRGNPAAVCLLPKRSLPLTDEVRQSIAAEMNLSETAFLEAADGSSSDDVDAFKMCTRFRLRWFTPLVEVPLCGHATLASAAALFQGASNKASTLYFETLSGTLTVQREDDNISTTPNLRMSLPMADVSHPPPSWLTTSSELVSICCGGMAVDDIRYTVSDGLKYAMLVLPEGTTKEQLEAINPDYRAMKVASKGDDVRGVIVTAAAGSAASSFHFYSRFFAPWCGIDEDPVTGSAHSVLGPYWAQRLDTLQLAAQQCSPRQGYLTVAVDPNSKRVDVSGQAVIVLDGHLNLP